MLWYLLEWNSIRKWPSVLLLGLRLCSRHTNCEGFPEEETGHEELAIADEPRHVPHLLKRRAQVHRGIDYSLDTG